MRFLTAFAVAFLLAGQASAQTIRGIGARPCAEWVQARRDGGRDFWAEQWVLGYLSGVNASDPSRQARLFANGDDKSVFAIVDGYCQAHAQDTLWSAVKAVISQRRAS
jgi:hypothetical protein